MTFMASHLGKLDGNHTEVCASFCVALLVHDICLAGGLTRGSVFAVRVMDVFRDSRSGCS